MAHRHATVQLELKLLVGETTRLELQELLRTLQLQLLESEKARAQQEKQIARLEMLLNKGQLEKDHARLEARLATRPHSTWMTLDSVVSERVVSERMTGEPPP